MVIDFEGQARDLPRSEASRAGNGRHLLVTRAGMMVQGNDDHCPDNRGAFSIQITRTRRRR